MHPRYSEWIDYVFDHPVTQPEWHWELDALSFEAEPIDEARLIELTFRHAARDLAHFTDAQVNQGLWYLCSPACCNHLQALRSEVVPLDLRLAGIASIGVLYRECFAHRCARVLSHVDEGPCSELNAACYMFWDLVPISYLEGNSDEAALADACFAVLAETMAIDHVACQEAAIHGYGHFCCAYPDRVYAALTPYIDQYVGDPRLKVYAIQARTGHIL